MLDGRRSVTRLAVAAHPLAGEPESVGLGRLGERREEGPELVQVHADAVPQEAVRPQLALDRLDARRRYA